MVENHIPLEMCLTSNVHTRALESIDEHPIRHYLSCGCVVTLSTDSRLVDGTTVSDEYWLAHTRLGFTGTENDMLILNAFQSAFLPEAKKAELITQVQRELAEIT